MYESERTRTEATNYVFLTNYLKARIENDEYLDKQELKRILEALEVKFAKKEIKNNESN